MCIRDSRMPAQKIIVRPQTYWKSVTYLTLIWDRPSNFYRFIPNGLAAKYKLAQFLEARCTSNYAGVYAQQCLQSPSNSTQSHPPSWNQFTTDWSVMQWLICSTPQMTADEISLSKFTEPHLSWRPYFPFHVRLVPNTKHFGNLWMGLHLQAGRLSCRQSRIKH